MSKQHYVRVEPGTPREKGDLFYCYEKSKLLPVKHFVGKPVHESDLLLRPVNPVPVNPWITNRKPEGSDAYRNNVEVWRDGRPMQRHYVQVLKGEPWRPIDQTPPPPAEPTEAELVEELLCCIESLFDTGEMLKMAKAIRAKQESEACNE